MNKSEIRKMINKIRKDLIKNEAIIERCEEQMKEIELESQQNILKLQRLL